MTSQIKLELSNEVAEALAAAVNEKAGSRAEWLDEVESMGRETVATYGDDADENRIAAGLAQREEAEGASLFFRLGLFDDGIKVTGAAWAIDLEAADVGEPSDALASDWGQLSRAASAEDIREALPALEDRAQNAGIVDREADDEADEQAVIGMQAACVWYGVEGEDDVSAEFEAARKALPRFMPLDSIAYDLQSRMGEALEVAGYTEGMERASIWAR